MPKTSAEIDRKTASKLLQVSIRTIDRYIRHGKLEAYASRGRIWLNKKEVLNFVPVMNKKSPVRSAAREAVQALPQKDNNFYRDFYEQARRSLADYQQKLEQANYRIGQLESQIIRPISHQRPVERREDLHGTEMLKLELQDRDKELETIQKLLKKERVNRTIFAILAYFLLILLPLVWYLVR